MCPEWASQESPSCTLQPLESASHVFGRALLRVKLVWKTPLETGAKHDDSSNQQPNCC